MVNRRIKLHPLQDEINHEKLNEIFKLGVVEKRTERIGEQYFVFRVSSVSKQQLKKVEDITSLKLSGILPTQNHNLIVIFKFNIEKK